MRSNFVGKNATFSLCIRKFFPIFVRFQNRVLLNFKIFVFLGLYFYSQYSHFLFQFYLGACKKMLYGLTLFLRSFLP